MTHKPTFLFGHFSTFLNGHLHTSSSAIINEISFSAIVTPQNYVNTKFSTRQQEAFNSMYNTQLELLKK
ncbi:hypothetical protein IDE00_002668 [Enterococcus faecalis]|nr:hypothetical protein [Enterococcus faecalis]EGO8511763.1 hypothetical protein [Enterococcus faecalis]EKZ0433893.1 hypothetical protein [Enterococcus faecalis]